MSISDKMKAQGFAIRAILDEVVTGIGATDEATFNAAAQTINAKAAAIRTWIPDGDYLRGDLAIDPADGVPYWAIHDHGRSSGHVCQPSASPTMWAHCHGTTPETARPFVAESYNPYNVGHYCTEGGTAYCCKQDAVVFAPSVWADGWEIVTT